MAGGDQDEKSMVSASSLTANHRDTTHSVGDPFP